MTALTWDATGERMYETGVDHGVLYHANPSGVYDIGYAWNGLVTVTESPTGAEATALYADNIKYLNLISVEEFAATVEAYTYPEQFAENDGSAVPETGVMIGQQARRIFGLAYRTRMGNDVEGTAYGYKLHLVYNAVAAPSEKAYSTINDTPEAITFSWEVSTTPTPVTGYAPTATLVIDSTKVAEADLAELEDMLYGTVGSDPMLPAPDDVIAIFAAALTEATPTEPAFNSGTETITIPTVTGVIYYNAVTGATMVADDYVITEDTVVKARPATGYKFPPLVVPAWFFDYTP
jgi:hypothetical protein